ncbi:MAG: acyltransferase [Hyphomicrobium sp.]
MSLARVLKSWIRRKILRRYTPKERLLASGARVGRGAFIGSGCVFDYDFGFLLDIGAGAVISSECVVELHDSCLPNALGEGPVRVGRVRIEERAYIGVRSIILPGVTVRRGAIVGAGSLVNREIPAGEVWAGVPVRRIGTVAELAQRRAAASPPEVRDYPWLGELEKLSVDYAAIKSQLLADARRDFR